METENILKKMKAQLWILREGNGAGRKEEGQASVFELTEMAWDARLLSIELNLFFRVTFWLSLINILIINWWVNLQ